jgi:predicted alpha/beta superfamily hydrolase
MKMNMMTLQMIILCCVCFLVVVGCKAQDIPVTFTVVAPSVTPKDAIVYIAGNHPLLGNWNPGAVALGKKDDSTWSRTFLFPAGQELEYKFTLGSWQSQALYHSAEIPPNCYTTVKGKEEIVFHPLNWSGLQAQESGMTGMVRYHRQLKGEGLNYPRDLIVWLPPSYEKKKSRRYPVLYMHDGQNIIDPATSFIGYDWHVDEVADSLIKAEAIEDIIVVGIYNSPDRIPEYSDSDLGKAYARFVVEKVKPFIDSTYRTKPDRKNTAVMGSSMGGLISFLFVWWYPEIFSKAGCLSSVFDTRAASVLDFVRAEKGKSRDVKFYFDCGGANGDRSLKPGMDELMGILNEKGYREGIDYQTFYDAKAEHSERAWAARVWRPLVFFFGK